MFRPVNGRVLIKPDAVKEATESGILLIDPQKEKPVIGIVIIGGEEVKAGDRVVFSKFGYDEVEIEKEQFYVVSEATILGIFDIDNENRGKLKRHEKEED